MALNIHDGKDNAFDCFRVTEDSQIVLSMQQRGRPKRVTKSPVRFCFEDMMSYALTSENGSDDKITYLLIVEYGEPSTFHEL